MGAVQNLAQGRDFSHLLIRNPADDRAPTFQVDPGKRAWISCEPGTCLLASVAPVGNDLLLLTEFTLALALDIATNEPCDLLRVDLSAGGDGGETTRIRLSRAGKELT